MCQVIVYLENLAEQQFELSHTLDAQGVQQVTIPGSIHCRAKLIWYGRSTECLAVAEYAEKYPTGVINPKKGEQDASDTGSMRLVIAVALQSKPSLIENSEAGASPEARFEARLCSLSDMSHPDQSPVEGLRLALRKAQDINCSSLGQPISGAGCEWRVVRCDSRVLEVRLRVLPTTTAPAVVSIAKMSQPERELKRQLTATHAADLSLARALQSVSRAGDRRAELLVEQCANEPPDPERIRNLPAKCKADYLLLFLLILLTEGRQALRNWSSSSELVNMELAEEEGAAADNPNAAASTEGSWSMFGTFYSYVMGSSDAQEAYSVLRSSLRTNAEHTFDGLLGLLRVKEDEEARRQGHDLLRSLTADWSVPAELSQEEIYASLIAGIGEEAKLHGEWSVEQGIQVGNVHDLVPLLSEVQLLSVEVAPSLQSAVDGLNSGRLFCPEPACAAFCPRRQQYILLYKVDHHEDAVALIERAASTGFSPSASSPSSKTFFFGSDFEAPVWEAADSPAHLESQFRRWESTMALGGGGGGSLPRIPVSWSLARDFLGLVLGGEGCFFNARTRATLFRFFAVFGVPPRLAARWEAKVGAALFDALEAQSVIEDLREQGQQWRRGKLALGVFGGGALLAVTGGLAAPAMAGGVAAVGTYLTSIGTYFGLTHAGIVVGGTIAGIGTTLATMSTTGAMLLFGSAGAGLAGWKLSHRWGELQQFEFEPLLKAKSYSPFSVDLKEPSSISALDAALEEAGGELNSGMLLSNSAGTPVALLKGSRLLTRSEIPSSPSSSSAEERVVRYDFERETDQVNRAVHMVVFASGWINTEEDFVAPWADVAPIFFPSSGHLAVKWEMQELMNLGQVMQTMLAQEVASQAASIWFRACGVAAASAGSFAAMTVSWPVALVASMANLDNAWTVGAERAYLAGQCLARVLADKSIIGQRPVTLIGHSVGARMIYNCLLELYEMKEFNVVDDVVLLAAAVPASTSEWQRVRAVASGRVVNGYVPSDWVIGFLYRYQEWGISVAGLTAVDAPGVENYDLTRLGVTGHREYLGRLSDILALMRIGERESPTPPAAAAAANPSSS